MKKSIFIKPIIALQIALIFTTCNENKIVRRESKECIMIDYYNKDGTIDSTISNSKKQLRKLIKVKNNIYNIYVFDKKNNLLMECKSINVKPGIYFYIDEQKIYYTNRMLKKSRYYTIYNFDSRVTACSFFSTNGKIIKDSTHAIFTNLRKDSILEVNLYSCCQKSKYLYLYDRSKIVDSFESEGVNNWKIDLKKVIPLSNKAKVFVKNEKSSWREIEKHTSVDSYITETNLAFLR